jgi:hypothetical protein
MIRGRGIRRLAHSPMIPSWRGRAVATGYARAEFNPSILVRQMHQFTGKPLTTAFGFRDNFIRANER